MKRNLLIGASIRRRCSWRSALAQSAVQRVAAAQAQGARAWRRDSRSIRRGPSRCRTAGIRARRSASGSMRRITSGSSIAPTSLDAVEGARPDAPTGECCKKAPPVLEFDQAGQPAAPLGRQGRPRLSVARRRTTACNIDNKGNIWIGGNGAHGRPRPEVHAGRQVRDAGRQEGRHARQPARRITSSWSPRRSSTRPDQRGRSSPTATATGASP